MTTKTENARKLRPLADVFESDNEYRVALDLVGVNRDNITLSLEQETLKVSARRDASLGEPLLFEREFGVPSTIDREKVAAGYSQGVLTVTLPKHSNSKPRRIPVATA